MENTVDDTIINERISKFTWTFREGQEDKMTDLAIMFNAPNCIIKIGQTISGTLLLNVIIVSA